MGRLERRLGEDDPVVGDDADLVAPDPGEATHDRGAPFGLERPEPRPVDETEDHLGGVEGDPVVGGDDAVELGGVEHGGFRVGDVEPTGRLVDAALVGVLTPATQSPVGLGFGGRDLVGDTGGSGVDDGTTEFVGVDDLAEGRFHDRGAAEEDPADALDHDHLVGQRGHVGATGGAPAEHDRELWETAGRQPGLAVEAAPEVVLVGEDLVLEREEGPAGVDEVDDPEVVLLRDVLGPDVFLDRHGHERAALDRGVVGDEDVGHAVDETDAGHDPRAGHGVVAVGVVVLAVAGECRELEERRPLVDHHVDPVPDHHLAPTEMAVDRASAPGPAVDGVLEPVGEGGGECPVGVGVLGEAG